jgi:ribosomal protection tetracycline resistance protein
VRILNLGILAHVDAGKTTLTERLLHAAGVIAAPGSVDAGSTQTDSLALERRRGITIKAAVVTFPIGDVTVNLIDTPGHPDFIAEVERVLSVLDGAVLVISAVEAVQAQTRILMRALQRLRIPTLIFVNKIDRGGAGYEPVLEAIARRLTPSIVPVSAVHGIGTKRAAAAPRAAGVEPLADNDDAVLAAYLNEDAIDVGAQLAAQTREALVHPVFFGSALTGAGTAELMAGIRELLPGAGGDPGAPVSGSVFKVERGPAGEKIAYARLFDGTLRVRDRVAISGDDEEKITAIGDGRDALRAGEIGRLWGLGSVRIGDTLGVPRTATPDEHHFAPPTLETIVVPRDPAERGALHTALAQLAEQDPLIGLRRDDLSVSLYGEVQKEVIQATLEEEYGLEVAFEATTTICVERPAGCGEAVEIGDTGTNRFLATIGLRVEPAPVGSGVGFRLAVELGSMPFAFFKAVEDTVRETLRQGLYGWEVPDCTVTMTRAGYWPRQSHSHQGFSKAMSSTGADFRGLTPLVLMTALRRAGTHVHEPMHRFALELPTEALGALLPALGRLGALPGTPVLRGADCTLAGLIPAARVHELRRRLPGLTGGEGVLESEFAHHAPVRGAPPTRRRTGPDPLDREGYLASR